MCGTGPTGPQALDNCKGVLVFSGGCQSWFHTACVWASLSVIFLKLNFYFKMFFSC